MPHMQCAAAYPKLRTDLVISRQETVQGPVYVFKDPKVGRFIRLQEPEFHVTGLLDGTNSLEEVRARSQEKLGGTLSPETLNGFVAKLHNLGMLESEATDTAAGARGLRPGRVRGDIFVLRFRVFDPDRFLAAIVPRLDFIFTRTFACISASVILLAMGVTIASWQELHSSFGRLYRVETLVLAWMTLLGVVIGHEFAHGVACKRFGGSVHEMGLLLIYLQPAMFCNVSDAWMFPERNKRLLVTLAGAWFELFVWALATLLWRVSDPAAVLNFLALVVATTLGIKSLFNLTPLIKLDGYYLLSDFLGVPNLRRNAFAHIGRSFGRIFRQKNSTAVRSVPRREARIYWIYGITAAVYSVWLLGFLLASLGAFLVAKYQGWGFALFAGLLTAVFRKPLRRGASVVALHLTPSKGMFALVKRLARIAAIFLVSGACLWWVRAELKVSGEFRILPLHNADVRAEVDGIIEAVLHDEGDSVEAGALIVRLSDRDYRPELEKVKAAIAEKTARLTMLRVGPRREEIELAKMAVGKGEERVKFAQQTLEIERSLFAEKLSSRKEFQAAEETAALRKNELEESQGNLQLLLAGSRPEEIEATEAEINRLQAEQNYLEGQLKRLRVVTPIAGVVTTHRLGDKVGAAVKKGDLIAEVDQLKTVTAEIVVPEKEISDVRLGQRVVLKARAYIEGNFEGKVVAISPVASKSETGLPQRTFLVTTQLDNSTGLLKSEMSGTAKIYCGVHRLYEIVFRRLIRFVRVEFWSWW